jgi:3-oxoacyl-[acyl-carrier protein] reductase
MSSEKFDNSEDGIRRREFIMAGAAGIAAVGAGMNTALAQPKAPGDTPRTNSKTGVRTAVITDAQLNIGPFLARKMAKLGYNLVIADVQEGLTDELRELGAAEVVVVEGLTQEGPTNESTPGLLQKVFDTAVDKFGGYDSVFIRTAVHEPAGDILTTDAENLFHHYEQNLLAALFGIQAALPPMMKAGAGQLVLQTSATGEKPQPTMLGYSVMRAAANMLGRCAAMTAAPSGVCVNVIGTNFMNYPGFREAAGAEDPEVYQGILNTIPMRRLGETEEAAHLALSLLDGFNMYTTGNFFPVAGGFNNAGMEPFGA